VRPHATDTRSPKRWPAATPQSRGVLQSSASVRVSCTPKPIASTSAERSTRAHRDQARPRRRSGSTRVASGALRPVRSGIEIALNAPEIKSTGCPEPTDLGAGRFRPRYVSPLRAECLQGLSRVYWARAGMMVCSVRRRPAAMAARPARVR